jgi:hypothetical protein
MTHYAVLRHNFDIQHNPDRLGPGHGDERFWLSLGSGGGTPSWLVGNIVWLVSWEGFMKTHHVVVGWFKAEQVGRRAGVVAQHYVSGNEGVIYPRGVGPLDMRPWFHKFVEANRKFREGEPTDIEEYTSDMFTLCQAAGYHVPTMTPVTEQPV